MLYYYVLGYALGYVLSYIVTYFVCKQLGIKHDGEYTKESKRLNLLYSFLIYIWLLSVVLTYFASDIIDHGKR